MIQILRYTNSDQGDDDSLYNELLLGMIITGTVHKHTTRNCVNSYSSRKHSTTGFANSQTRMHKERDTKGQSSSTLRDTGLRQTDTYTQTDRQTDRHTHTHTHTHKAGGQKETSRENVPTSGMGSPSGGRHCSCTVLSSATAVVMGSRSNRFFRTARTNTPIDQQRSHRTLGCRTGCWKRHKRFQDHNERKEARWRDKSILQSLGPRTYPSQTLRSHVLVPSCGAPLRGRKGLSVPGRCAAPLPRGKSRATSMGRARQTARRKLNCAPNSSRVHVPWRAHCLMESENFQFQYIHHLTDQNRTVTKHCTCT